MAFKDGRMVLAQPWGGLGDNLQFSTLPELCAREGIDFYLSSENAYRNEEIYELVWRDNPYVRGVVDDQPNAGATLPWVANASHYNIIGLNELRHGFSAENRHAKIQYTPKKLDRFFDAIVVDVGAVSSFKQGFYDIEVVKSLITEQVGGESFFLVVSKYDSLFGKFHVENGEELHVESLFDYCDILHSCKSYFCLLSGGQVLSSLIQFHNRSNVEIFCLFPHFNYLSYDECIKQKDWIFDNVKYVTKNGDLRVPSWEEGGKE